MIRAGSHAPLIEEPLPWVAYTLSLSGGSMARVLLVDDEPSIVEAVGRGLRAEGMAVDSAADGVDGLWKATNQRYDVIILDVMLPGLSGYEVLKRTRTAEVWAPILMLTAKDGEYDIADALDRGPTTISRSRSALWCSLPASAHFSVGASALDLPSSRPVT